MVCRLVHAKPLSDLTQCWNTVNWTHRNKLQWNFTQNSFILIYKNPFENIVRRIAAILSRPQCVKIHLLAFNNFISESSLLNRRGMKTRDVSDDGVLCLTATQHFLLTDPWHYTVYHSWEGHTTPDSKVHEAYMGPTWGRQDPGGPHVGPMNLAIRDVTAARRQGRHCKIKTRIDCPFCIFTT